MSVELDGANNTVKTDTISEVTSANGVTIDGLNIKDSAITDYPKGITVADQWFLTANTAMAAGANDITSNLARTVSSPFGSIGSAMTESSGIFTFPSTGIYEVRASFQGDASDANDSYQGLIQSTTDNSSYGVRAIAYNYLDQITMTISAIFDITNVSNDKVKFSTQNVASGQTATLLGNSGQAQTCFLFLRLGDT
tara:strand:- start:1026 stop:1613 length:588 start_codon:yes stop_codon:yes gene_type:complete